MSDQNVPERSGGPAGRFPGLHFVKMNELTEVILKECYTQDILNDAEYEDRVSRMHRARSVADLEALIEDLPVNLPDCKKRPPLLHHRRTQNISVFLGEKKAAGERLNCKYTDIVAVMGDLTLDFRDVTLPPGVTTIKLTGVMSDMKIIVPPELTVESDIAQIMATVKEDRFLKTRQDPGKPVLKILGFILMSEVKIKVKELFE